MPETSTIEILEPGLNHDLEFRITEFQQNIDRLESEVPTIGDGQVPEWWSDYLFTGQRELRNNIKDSQEVEPSSLADFATLFIKQYELKNEITQPDHPVDGLNQAIYELGPDKFAKALADEEKGPVLKYMVVERIAKSEADRGSIGEELNVLKAHYETDSVLDLFAADEKLAQVLAEENTLSKVIFAHEKTLEGIDDEDYDQKRSRNQAMIAKIIQGVSGMTPEEALGYAFGPTRSIGNVPGFSEAIKKVQYFGKERLKNITRKTGIQGIDGYTTAQLENMEQFVVDPEGFAENLKERDVNVVLVNRSGDHNAIFRTIGEEFEEDTDRTVFFEINRIADIYKHMVSLRRAGIEPSSMVLAAHSSEGHFIVADYRDGESKKLEAASIAGENLVRLANEGDRIDEKGREVTRFSMHGLEGFSRLVDKYMAPSKGVDEPESEAGKKKIIFKACHVGSEVDMNNKDDEGNTVHMGTESVVSQLGKQLAEHTDGSVVEVYGARGGMQSHKTKNGMRFSGQAKEGLERSKLKAVKVTVKEGSTQKSEVDEIILRK